MSVILQPAAAANRSSQAPAAVYSVALPEKAMSPDYAARAIVRAAERGKPLVVIDRPHLRVAFWVMRRAPRLRVPIIADAYKKLTRERRAAVG